MFVFIKQIGEEKVVLQKMESVTVMEGGNENENCYYLEPFISNRRSLPFVALSIVVGEGSHFRN